MDYKNTEFPQFRKLSNDSRFYHILGERHFVELQRLGQKVIKFEMKATQYPEFLLIDDMLACRAPYVMSDEKEFQLHEQKIS